MKPAITILDTLPHNAADRLAEGWSVGDLHIVNAARTSFLGESKGADKDRRLLSYLWREGHMSPFEQVVIKLRIHAPLIVWWQWVRYRHQSMNLQSGRYVEFEPDEFYYPDAWRLQSQDNKQGSAGLADAQKQDVLNDLFRRNIQSAYAAYQLALDMGIAKEQARLFLPAFAVYYTGVTTLNLRSAMHIIRQRTDEHAQYEIRQYALELRSQLTEYFPATMELLSHDK